VEGFVLLHARTASSEAKEEVEAFDPEREQKEARARERAAHRVTANAAADSEVPQELVDLPSIVGDPGLRDLDNRIRNTRHLKTKCEEILKEL
jgi:hypothetical protein